MLALIALSTTLATLNILISYKHSKYIPPGPGQPFLSILWLSTMHMQSLIPWPFLVRLSTIARGIPRDLDRDMKKEVKKALMQYQAGCLIAVGTAVVPFIWIAWCTSGEGGPFPEERMAWLWVFAAAVWCVCYVLWKRCYDDNSQRIQHILSLNLNTTDLKSSPQVPDRDVTNLQEPTIPQQGEEKQTV